MSAATKTNGTTHLASHVSRWPALPVASWQDSRDTLHLWTQIVGKTKLALAPPMNHWWGITLQVNATGLTTSLMPYPGGGALEISFDFNRHALILRTMHGRQRTMRLERRSVADFYREYVAHRAALGVHVDLNTTPVDISEVIPFEKDTLHATYEPGAVHDFWISLVSVNQVLQRFRGEFHGKASPVHLFWGAFDLAVTRFSGRPAPDHPGGIPHCPDWVMREAYNSEVSSCRYWPGGNGEGIFYSYAYPEPAGFRSAAIDVPGAAFNTDLGEFVLPYSSVRTASEPEALLNSFLQQTWMAAAELGSWPGAPDE